MAARAPNRRCASSFFVCQVLSGAALRRIDLVDPPEINNGLIMLTLVRANNRAGTASQPTITCRRRRHFFSQDTGEVSLFKACGVGAMSEAAGRRRRRPAPVSSLISRLAMQHTISIDWLAFNARLRP